MLFVELEGFSDDWAALNLTLDGLFELQNAIRANPAGFPVIPGTGGLRKLRFAPLRSSKGKRGGVRVCYAYFPAREAVLLVWAYPKSQKENLSAQEKKAIRAYLDGFGEGLNRRRPDE